MLRYLVNLVFTLSRNPYTSSGWYRKYSDGWIIQGGVFSGKVYGVYMGTPQSQSQTFLTAFTSTPIFVSIDPAFTFNYRSSDANYVPWGWPSGLTSLRAMSTGSAEDGEANISLSTTQITVAHISTKGTKMNVPFAIRYVICGK